MTPEFFFLQKFVVFGKTCFRVFCCNPFNTRASIFDLICDDRPDDTLHYSAWPRHYRDAAPGRTQLRWHRNLPVVRQRYRLYTSFYVTSAIGGIIHTLHVSNLHLERVNVLLTRVHTSKRDQWICNFMHIRFRICTQISTFIKMLISFYLFSTHIIYFCIKFACRSS